MFCDNDWLCACEFCMTTDWLQSWDEIKEKGDTTHSEPFNSAAHFAIDWNCTSIHIFEPTNKNSIKVLQIFTDFNSLNKN